MIIFSDKNLSKKLELTEANANANFVNARAKMQASSGAEWINVNGTYALFDGITSPLTQTFGLGLYSDVTHDDLEMIEKFFQTHGAMVFHEVSPMADPAHLTMLHERGYIPVELTSVMYKTLTQDNVIHHPVNLMLAVKQLPKGEEDKWARVAAQGWSTEMEGLSDFIYQLSSIAANSDNAFPFYAELDSKMISTGMLNIHNDVAILAGASTIPEGRNRGAQNALLNARLNYAANHGCTLAMMCASPGSQSQKNAEKNGFRIAYTRTKWKLMKR